MKVYPFNIPKPINENLVLQIDEGIHFYDKLHQHEEIQLSLIVRGQGKLIVADSIHQFEAGDIFVIGRNCPHLFQDNGLEKNSCKMISLFFTKYTFGEEFFNNPELEEINQFFPNAESGFQLLTKKTNVAHLIYKISETDKFNRFLLFLKLLKKICHAKTKVLTKFVYPKTISLNEGQRMRTIFDYVIHNFQNEISLNTISSIAYMTPNAFCRFFKQRTNKTFFQFLIELRVEHACQLLLNQGDLSVTEVSDASGFNSISNFNRKFKVLKGTTPSEYKELKKSNIYS
ncbi:AraC family transcriptional regulator [Sediminicola arcticus]|jgi:AraC-like DNA-binding protein|uniref:AraC family transcriptional regulator n=1 Tax=Sediminicola arcticus TaxID=1574308 RepID=A0ABV2SUQ9_9FLAO